MKLEECVKMFDIPKHIERIIITCVDPHYPVSSLGINDVEVYYDDDHVQKSVDSTHIYLVYNSETTSFHEINADNVHKSLSKGVVQLAYKDNTLVFGIPGDVYAFHPDGEGFGFGTPGKVPSLVAKQLLNDIMKHSDVRNENMKIIVMAHNDCGLYANNVGKHCEEHKSAASFLNHDGSGFHTSEYCQMETEAKQESVEHLSKFLHNFGIPESNLRVITPEYKARTPGIIKAMEGAH